MDFRLIDSVLQRSSYLVGSCEIFVFCVVLNGVSLD
jgi:hypothetical protein